MMSIWRTADAPLRVFFVENPEPTSPFGTKALGEPPACSPAPAIRNAILNATGVSRSPEKGAVERDVHLEDGGRSVVIVDFCLQSAMKRDMVPDAKQDQTGQDYPDHPASAFWICHPPDLRHILWRFLSFHCVFVPDPETAGCAQFHVYGRLLGGIVPCMI